MSNKVIKAENVKIINIKERLPAGFAPAGFKAKGGGSAATGQRGYTGTEDLDGGLERRINVFKKEAYDKGFSEGMEAGKNKTKEKLFSTLGAVGRLVEELKMLKKEFLEKSEEEMLDLVFLIAGKVIHKETTSSREIVLAVLRDTLQNIQDSEGIKIRLNPQDYEYIMEAKPDFASDHNGIKTIQFEKDIQVDQGGAIVETHFGEIDARLDQQLDRIRESLR